MPGRELGLDAEPDAPARARSFLRAALALLPPDVVADAELVTTELVTNAQLHGAGPITVRASWAEPCVLVEVQDSGRDLPVLPVQSTEAMTGRGLTLVAALSSAWGVRPVPDGPGKVVWAELGGTVDATGPDLDVEALLAAWPDEQEPGEPTFTVRLGEVPTDLLLDAKRHIDNVVRELTLERAGGAAASIVPGFSALVETVTKDFAGARAAIKRQAVEAAARGDEQTELVLTLPASAADAGERYLEALDEADRCSRAARLLTLESPTLHRVFRTWYVQSLVDQLRARASGDDVPPARPFVRVLSDEVTALSSLRVTAERLALLQRVNSDLVGAQTQQDIAAVVAGHATESLGALAAMVFVVDGDVLRPIHVHGPDARSAQRFVEVPLDADLPDAVAFTTGRPILLRSLAQMTERFPVLGDVYDSDRVLHVVPLIVGEHRLGVLSLSFPPGGEFDEDTLTHFVQALANALAQALERAKAMDAAAAAAQRLAFLADASMALTASLDFEQTVDAVTALLVPRLADWCTLVLLEDGELTPVGIAHRDPDTTRWAWQVVRAYPTTHLDAPHGDAAVLRTGRSELFAVLPDELVAAAAVDAEHLRLLRQVGMHSAMAVPLPGRTGVIGVLSVMYAESGRQYAPDDVPFVEDVARRAALALEAARVLRDQSGRLADVTRVAEAAQRAILAAPPARVGPVALAARYTSATAEALVGGDLFETVVREGAVRLLMGDVRGKGLGAVRTATIVLGEFRAGAADLDDLGDVARQIDRRVRAYLGDEDFITALLAEVRDDGTFTVASCGHPPALLAGAGGITPVHTEPALPLGLGADPTPVTGRLRPGERLLLHTDGILEARDPERRFVDVMELVRPLTTGRLEQVLDDILEHLHGLVGADLGDDLALLVAEYQG